MCNQIPKDAYAIIIGSMKCGTTSLYSYLQNHPEICPAVIKEPEFFSENQHRGAQVSDYNSLWSFDESAHKYALEASTGYTKYPSEPHVAENIFRYGIKPKFMYIIRNPFDRIESHFNYMNNKRLKKSNIVQMHYINSSNYFLQLEQYRKYFPMEDILILDFDELKNNPALLLQKIYCFLNISPRYFPEEFKVVHPTQFKSKSELILKKLKLDALYGYVPRPLKQHGKNLLRRVFPAKKRVLTDKEKECVYTKLRVDMANLRRTYGFDVRKWGFDS